MEYVYAALLLDAAGKEINEKSIEEVVKAAGMTPDQAQAKAVAASLKGVNIKDVTEERAKHAGRMQQLHPQPRQLEAPAMAVKRRSTRTRSRGEEERGRGCRRTGRSVRLMFRYCGFAVM
jgi:large subunit ribosomal protein L12